WIVFCKIVVGSYYNHELVTFHQFVWLPEAIGRGPGATWDWVSTLGSATVRGFFHIEAIPLVVLAVLSIAALLLHVRTAPANAEQRALLLSAVLAVAFGVLFYLGMGIVVDRLMYQATPGMLVVIGWLAPRLPLNRTGRFVTIGVLGVAAIADIAI